MHNGGYDIIIISRKELKNMEQEVNSSPIQTESTQVQVMGAPKKCKHMPIIVVLSVLVVFGIGFGGFELWQNIQKDDQIATLKAQLKDNNSVNDNSYILVNNGEMTIKAYPPEPDVDGGATRYEISGVYSVEEANAALIEHSYNNKVDGLEPDIRMTSQEAQELASEIAKSGCGLITKEYAGTPPPPIDDARMWSDYGNDNYDTIMIYMLGDGKHYAYTDCQNTKK